MLCMPTCMLTNFHSFLSFETSQLTSTAPMQYNTIRELNCRTIVKQKQMQSTNKQQQQQLQTSDIFQSV